MARKSLSLVALLTLVSCCAFAQLTIDNPRHLDVPEARAHLLLRMSCQAVGRELHLADSSKVEFGLHLVLGEKIERFGWDEHTGMATVFLSTWDTQKFTTAAMRFAVQRSIDPHREEQMVLDVVRRSEQTAPVAATELRGLGGLLNRQPANENNCLRGVVDATVRETRCDAMPAKTR